jgi:protoporphyrinogen/coproporphyrinogen III oxidase
MRGDRGIGIVGAGPAGLAAAWRLVAGGRRVRLYESGSVGGRMRTERLGAAGADVAIQLLSNGYTRTIELAEAVGAAHLLRPVPGRDAMWRNGRAHSLRYGSVTSMAASGALPAGLKMKLGLKYVRFLDRHGDALDLNAPAMAGEAGLDGETIAEWGRRELGEDFVELMAYPLLAAYYGVTPEETGAGVFHGLARAGLEVQLLGVQGGVGSLSEAIVAWLESAGVEILAGRRVEGVEPTPTGARVRSADGSEEHDGVVVAVPAEDASRLLPGVDLLRGIGSRSSATLVLATDRPVGEGWFGLSIPRREALGERVAAVCVLEEKQLEGVGPGLVVVPAPAVGERWAEAEPAVALEAALPVVETVLPAARARIVEARLVRHRGSTFIPAPGHFERAARLAAAGVPASVALAGDYLVAPTVEGAVRSGIAAADRLMADRA